MSYSIPSSFHITMGIFSKISGFGNPITAGRRTCGTCLVVIGLIMLIPSIIGWVWAGSIYNGAEIDFANTATTTSPGVDDTLTVTANNLFRAGNNYDVKYEITAVGPFTLEQTGQFSVLVSCSGLDTAIQDLRVSDSSFNETVTRTSSTIERENDFSTDVASVDFTFTIESLNNVTSMTMKVRVFENPKRTLVRVMNNVSLIIAIPGAIVCCCGCVVAPPSKKQ